jgi:hypothetical protein
MKKSHIYFLAILLFLTFGMVLFQPTDAHAEENSAKWKSMNLSTSLTHDETGKKWTCTLTWDAVKGCTDYQIYKAGKTEKGDGELIATVSDGICQYQDDNLAYESTYTYTIYACKNSNGILVKKYYSDETIAVKLIGIRGVTEEIDFSWYTTPNSIEIGLYTTRYDVESSAYCNAITPEYVEIKRYNYSTHSTSKKSITWEELEAAGFHYTDNSVKAKTTYRYTFRSYIIVNGKKWYSDSFERVVSSYNNEAGNENATVSLEIQKSSSAKTLVVKLTNSEGNAPLLINKKDMNMRLVNDTLTDESKAIVQLKAVSYDGENWITAKNNLYITLNGKESVYLKLKYKSGAEFDYTNPNSRLSAKFTYLYYNQDSLHNNYQTVFEYQGKLKNKKLKLILGDND